MGVRFAPSPTGVFHVGNLRTAWISHWWARRLAKPWVVRFEDIDGPRVASGARERQLSDMASLGLVPDQMLLQSRAHRRHFEAFCAQASAGRLYVCTCSRKDVRDALEGAASAPHVDPPLYSGRCREQGAPQKLEGLATLAWRIRSPDPSGKGDFIVARSATALGPDGLPLEQDFTPSYNWACAVDDLDGDYDLLVRAWDLEPVLAQQRQIQKLLAPTDWIPPATFHCALVTQDSGERLEKRTHGVTLPELGARGVSPEKLLELFRSSFEEPPGALPRGASGGERARSKTLSELGL